MNKKHKLFDVTFMLLRSLCAEDADLKLWICRRAKWNVGVEKETSCLCIEICWGG